ncbi:MAG: response regulator, partial [Pseudomonadota bacterium]
AALNEEIAERERSQIRASARATRLIQAAQLSKLGYYVRDVGNGRCIYCSAQHASSYGLSQADYIEKACAIDDQVAMIHPDDREAVRASYEKLRSGEQIEIEYRVETERGTRRIREAACPILDVEGRIVQEIGSTVDFTEQYETEMKLFESQRLDSIGKMTGGVAHDFNNLLSVILGNLELIRAMDRNPERRELTDDAISASRRASDLVRNMLSFARRAPLKPTEFNLNEVIGAMQDLLHRALPETIKLETQLSLDLPPVHADKSSTESALLNLILNARDALPRGGTITIETSHVTMTAGQTDLTPGDYAQLSVRDTGSGIDPELLPKIFEPFVSSKDPSSNSGLGLSMVHGFMQQSEGGVRVSTGAESGTAIDLFFPARPALLVAANGVAAEPQEAKIGARILLVEDEPQVRKTVRMHLDRAGMNVAEAANGTEAQKIFEASGPFDLLLTDMVMPGEIQGTQLAANLRERAPELRVIFLSGYSHEADAGDPVAINDTYLMKPTPRDALLGAISKALA